MSVSILRGKDPGLAVRSLIFSVGMKCHKSQNLAGQCLTLSKALAAFLSTIQYAGRRKQKSSLPLTSLTLVPLQCFSDA